MPTTIWLPIVISVAALMGLLLLFRLLRRYQRIRNLGGLYVAGAGLLGLFLLLDGEGLLPSGWPRSLLLSALLIAWGYIAFDIAEDLLIERWMNRHRLNVPRLVRDILRIVALVTLVLVAINQVFEVPLGSLVISSTVISAVIGLALQDLLKNVIAGVALEAENPFRPGDWVQINGQIAQVVEMSWRATRLVTVDNTHISVPNGTMAQADIHNFTIVSPLQALHVQLVTNLLSPPEQVKQVLIAATLTVEGVLAQPAPRVRLIAINADSATYDIKFWMPGFDRHVETRDGVLTHAWYALRRAGIASATPKRELRIQQASSYDPLVEQQQQQALAATTLATIPLFAMLTPSEREQLAERAHLRLYTTGDVLVRQGDTHDDALYVIRKGSVCVTVGDATTAATVTVGQLQAGDLFGELSLLTGEARTATVTAEQDTEALVVDREAIAPLFINNPALPEHLSIILEQRVEHAQQMLAAHRLAVSSEPDNDLSQSRLLRRIRSLFRLDG